MHYDSFFWNSLGNYRGIIVQRPTRALVVVPPWVSLKPCKQSRLIGWQSLEGHVLTSFFFPSLSSGMNKAFSDHIKQGLFNRSQPCLRSGNRELPWARGQAVGRNHTDKFTPLPLQASWIGLLDFTADSSQMDNEKWKEQKQRGKR